MRNSKGRQLPLGIVAAVVVVIVAAALVYKFALREDLYKGIPVVAHLDGKPIYLSEAEGVVEAVVPPKDGKKVTYNDLDENSKMVIIREVAAQKLMLDKAKKDGIVADRDIKRSVKEFRDRLIRERLFGDIAKKEITEEKMQERYKEIEDSIKGKTQFKLRHILLDTEDDAKEAEKALKKSSFTKVAKELSKDSSTKDRGGELGYMLSGAMDENIEKAALDMKIGDVSDPIKTKFGWHIVKLEEKKVAHMPKYEELRRRIAEDLYTEALKRQADKLLADVKIDLEKQPKVAEAPKTPEATEPAAGNSEDKAESDKVEAKESKDTEK